MAYSNYEGKAFRDGEHFHSGCDAVIPLRRYDGQRHMFHALLGEGPIRVGLRKTYPMLLVEGPDGVFDEPVKKFEGQHEIDGYRAYAHSVGNHVAATLVEPDGTIWTGMAAYETWESWCEEDR